ncbi:MAG: hypothetical protein ACIAQZ_06550 [Sedimentisphaeraceae bacterium JB056]
MRYFIISLLLLLSLSLNGCRYAEVPQASEGHPAVTTSEETALHLEPAELVIDRNDIPKKPSEFNKK